MADRRSSERLIVPPESLERLTPDAMVRRATERVIAPAPAPECEDRTEPMKLSFLALLAERDPLVQARLNSRITPVLELENANEDERPTDPLILTAKFSG